MTPQTTRHETIDDAVDQQTSSDVRDNPQWLYKRCDCASQSTCEHVWHYKFKLNGKAHRGTTHTRTRQLAERQVTRVRNAALDGKTLRPAKSKTTLEALVATFLEHYKQEHPATYVKARVVLPRFVEFMQTQKAGARVADVSPFHIDKWKLARASDVERSTVSRELNLIKALFRRAVEWRHVETSPAADVKKYKTDDTRVRWLDDDELAMLLSRGDADVVLMCETTLECLARLSEVLHLRREHIGPSWMEIRRKGGRVDRIEITKELRAKLVKRCHRSGWIFGVDFPGVVNQTRAARRRAARHAANPATRIRRKVHQQGDPLTQQAATNSVRREFARLGITGASHHTMRHTGVTLMLEAGVNPRTIQKLAGWTSLRMLERYGHARDAESKRAVAAMRDVVVQAHARALSLPVETIDAIAGHTAGHTGSRMVTRARAGAGR